MSKDLLAEILRLSPAERLQIVEDIWTSLSPDDLKVTDDEMRELERRIARSEDNPARGKSWPEVKERLTKELLAHE
jgi:putative addiction module component (TIGR02574 family)